ncbi:hypothetical protein [Terasakiella pusilla]|uniref:hypothetical protein n=1 Tax=Terasakiella pusilla TaxID=64973 RepID=UPI003AA7B164
MDNPAFGKEPYTRAQAWCWLIEAACFKDVFHDIKGQSVVIQRGQICKASRELASEWKWAETKVRRFLDRLTSEGMISTDVTFGKTIITICNYDLYQASTTETDAEERTPQAPENDEMSEKSVSEDRLKTSAESGALESQGQQGFWEDGGATIGAKAAQDRRNIGAQKKEGNKGNKGKDIYTPEFLKFWDLYPKRVAKADAAKAFKGAIKTTALEVILDGVRRAQAHWDKTGTDNQYIPYPASWLRAESWEDEFQPQSISEEFDDIYAGVLQ